MGMLVRREMPAGDKEVYNLGKELPPKYPTHVMRKVLTLEEFDEMRFELERGCKVAVTKFLENFPNQAVYLANEGVRSWRHFQEYAQSVYDPGGTIHPDASSGIEDYSRPKSQRSST